MVGVTDLITTLVIGCLLGLILDFAVTAAFGALSGVEEPQGLSAYRWHRAVRKPLHWMVVARRPDAIAQLMISTCCEWALNMLDHTVVMFPLLEVATGLFLVLDRMYVGLGVHFYTNLLLFFIVMSIAVVNVGTNRESVGAIIPDELSLGGLVLGLLISGAQGMASLADSIGGVLLGFGLFLGMNLLSRLAFRKEAMGAGSMKMQATIGVFLGWKGVIAATGVSILSGMVYGVLLLIVRRGRRDEYIPFGNHQAVGAVVVMLWYPQLASLGHWWLTKWHT